MLALFTPYLLMRLELIARLVVVLRFDVPQILLVGWVRWDSLFLPS